MPRKAGLGSADVRRDAKSSGGFLSIPESYKDREEGECTFFGPCHTRDSRHHTCMWAHKGTETRQTMMARRVAFLTPVQSFDPNEQVIHSPTSCMPSPCTEAQARQQPKNKDASTRRVSPLDPTLPAFLMPDPPHLGLRICDRPRCQKLLHHRRMPFQRSKMQRRVSILRRAAALNQAHQVSAQVNAPPPTPVTLCITNLDRGKQRWSQTTHFPRNHDATKSWFGIRRLSSWWQEFWQEFWRILSIAERNTYEEEGARTS